MTEIEGRNLYRLLLDCCWPTSLYLRIRATEKVVEFIETLLSQQEIPQLKVGQKLVSKVVGVVTEITNILSLENGIPVYEVWGRLFTEEQLHKKFQLYRGG